MTGRANTCRGGRAAAPSPGCRHRTARVSEEGFTLIETLAALAVFSLMLTALAGLWQHGQEQLSAASAARHLSHVTQAAKVYALAHHDTLLAASTSSSGPELRVTDLVESGCLPEGFVPTSTWHQDYAITTRVQTLPSGTRRLMLLILTTGGHGAVTAAGQSRLASVSAPAAARLAGGEAGYVAGAGNAAGYAEGCLVSAWGGYTLDLASIGVQSPGAGHLGAWLVCEAESASADVLYRVAVDGHPELNQMEVNLDMTQHTVTGIGSIQLVSWGSEEAGRPLQGGSCSESDLGRVFLDENNGLYLCRRVAGSATPELVLLSDSGNAQSVRQATLVTDNDLVAKPACAADARLQPRLFLAQAIASSGPSSPAMSAFRAWATEEGESWRVHLKVRATGQSEDDPWYTPANEGERLAPYYGSALALAVCARDTD